MRSHAWLIITAIGFLLCTHAFAQNPCLIVIHHAIGVAELRDNGLDRDAAIERQLATRSTNALQTKEHERALVASVARWAYIQRDIRPANFGAFHYSACRF